MIRYSDMGQEERTHDLESRQRPDHDTRANAADDGIDQAEYLAYWFSKIQHDVRPCINPVHLYVGTRKDNMADCTARGRHNKPRGEKHWAAKLAAQDIKIIRADVAAGISQSAVALRFGVHHSTISRIARGIWRTEVSL